MSDKIAFVAQGYEDWPIHLGADHPTARLAAEELQTYILRITDRRLPIVTDVAGLGQPCIELQFAQGESDGFVREVSAGGIRLIGRSPRGLLCAVYDLLEELGCRWYFPGPLGERIPRSSSVELSMGIKDEEPALPGRGLIIAHDRYLPELRAWIAWASRNRLNTIFLHPFPPIPEGGKTERFWRRALAQAEPELRLRGLSVEYGGHLLPALLPRRFYWSQRLAFRFDGQRRNSDHNLCPSDAGGRRIVRERARRFFLKRGGVDVYHIWPDDVGSGAWCQCPHCRDLSPSDQALLFTNEIAEVLAEVKPGATISYLAYHDTLEPPATVKPRPNVALCYAPRERCYAHGLADGQCALNAEPYEAALDSLRAWFGEEGQPGPQAFEYYLDGVLYKGLCPPLPKTMAADLAAYRKAGYQSVSAVMTSWRPWLGVPTNAFLFGKLAWNPAADADALLRTFARDYYGGPEGPWAEYLGEMEAASQLLLDLQPEEHAFAETGAKPSFPWLPRDVLDFHGAPLEARRAKLATLAEARRRLDKAEEWLESASRPGAGHKPRGQVTRQEVLERERAELDYARRLMAWLHDRQLAACLVGERARRRDIRTALKQAGRSLRQVTLWGRQHLAAQRGWRRQFRWMCDGFKLQLWELRRDGLAWGPPGRLFWRLRAMDTLFLAKLKVRLQR
ncbi:MAG: DUF4838 domain-containing protein [Chloroflexi bacterium]|nr:DUF4838 domain-containing protein [Chloroflexota bacterium]